MSDVEFTNHSDEVRRQIQQNIEKALHAMGEACVEVTTDYMRSHYSKPIYQTGDLQRDINFDVNVGSQTVQIGNSLEYAPWVHNGTRNMTARPYLKDAIEQNVSMFEEIAAEQLNNGMDD